MDFNEILNQQKLSLERARQSLSAVTARDNAPVDLTQPRVALITAQIAELNAQKQREIARYDAAIAELNHELGGLTVRPPANTAVPAPNPIATATETAKEKTPKKARARK